MAKFGKPVKVTTDLSKYILGILAPSGWGKSTLLKNVCEKLYGEEGYICADFGMENGYAAIDGAIVESCPNWKHFKDMVDDIVKNKETDYKQLKVVVIDTLDFCFDAAEEFTVLAYNREHMGEQNFRPAKSINGVEGFGKGLDLVINNVRKEINRLASVGVGTWFAAHIKEREQTDLMTGNAFTQITCAMTNRYYTSIKNIAHCIGVGYYARTMNEVEVGAENAITHKKKTRNAMMEEERRIVFHDTAFLCDSKSRFPDIESDIRLNADEYIRVITEAVEKAAKTPTTPTKSTKKKDPKVEEPVVEEEIEEVIEDVVEETPFDLEESIEGDIFEDELEEEAIAPVDKASLTAIRGAYKEADAETKAKVKTVLADYGNKLANEMRPSDVNKIIEILDI